MSFPFPAAQTPWQPSIRACSRTRRPREAICRVISNERQRCSVYKSIPGPGRPLMYARSCEGLTRIRRPQCAAAPHLLGAFAEYSSASVPTSRSSFGVFFFGTSCQSSDLHNKSMQYNDIAPQCLLDISCFR